MSVTKNLMHKYDQANQEEGEGVDDAASEYGDGREQQAIAVKRLIN